MRFETNGFVIDRMSRTMARPFRAESGSFNLSFARGCATAFPSSQELTNGLDRGPLCFKLIGELINEDQIILGGEESKGLSIKGHYPKKDGVIASWLKAEAVASRKSIGAPIGRRIGFTLKRINNQ